MRIDVVTLFPEMFDGVLSTSILKRAAEPGPEGEPAPVEYHLTDIRDHADDPGGRVDKPPYG
ncbi:MAG: hypothetical protein R3336_09245, partial [Phycisphaeraceae bacterium]|nr:hypothetical protein [Phycisphaeraceae bacterium]